MTDTEYLKYLQNCVEDYIKDGRLFEKWFFEKGKSYFFLFKKNLKVTNMQFAELISLIRIHATNEEQSTDKKQHVGKQLLILSVKEFKTAFDEIILTFKPDGLTKESLLREEETLKKLSSDVAKNFYDLLRNTIVIDTFFGSCAVYLPPQIEIDIKIICAQSGYIHSCGTNVYTRNVSKATQNEFLNSIDKYFKKVKSSKKIFFAVYAHEDFSKYDRNVEDELRYGLDDVKVHVEKYYMARDSLVDILKTMSDKFKHKLIIPDAGNYNEKHIEKRNSDKVEKDKTLWLVIDNAISNSNIQQPASEKYYICYEQLWLNENQFHIFDESKPAWKSSTTIPHTLLGAMINIALPHCSNLRHIDLADPFVGTGTTLFECCKYESIIPHISDLDWISQLLIKDNANFFTLTAKELKALIAFFEAIELMDYWNLLSRYIQIISEANDGEFLFSEDDVSKLETLTFNVRIIFYILLRVKINSIHSLSRGSNDVKTAFKMETQKLTSQIKRLIVLKEKNDESSVKFGNHSLFQGSYSKSCMITADLYSSFNKKDYKSWDFFDRKDVLDLKPNSYDIIITDPPYGFNTKTDISELATLYREMIKKLISALKDDGQIVMSLPDRSHSGKRSPFFTHKEIVIQQFLMIAQETGMNKEIVNTVTTLPTPQIFKPPYYWESERALRRSILYFRIRTKNVPSKQ